MRFWDSSAIVPLVVEERRSRSVRDLIRRDARQILWWFSRTEVLSALARRMREGMAAGDVQAAEARLHKLAARWAEVDAIEQVREGAERLVRIHPLCAADATQLAAALLAFDGRPRGRGFVTLDDNLGGAARREGFDILP